MGFLRTESLSPLTIYIVQGSRSQLGRGTGPPLFPESSMLHYLYVSLSPNLVSRPLHFESRCHAPVASFKKCAQQCNSDSALLYEWLNSSSPHMSWRLHYKFLTLPNQERRGSEGKGGPIFSKSSFFPKF